STFFVGTNGYVTFGAGDSNFTESLSAHFSLARVAALFDDLNPGTGGQVSYKQLADRMAITWLNVPEFGTANHNTVEVELYFDGRISLSYLAVAALDGLAGLSEGTGLAPDFFETDLSALTAGGGPLPPFAAGATVSTAVDTPVNITLPSSDPHNDPLTTITVSLPANGTLSDPNGGLIGIVPYTLLGGGNVARYMPNAAFTGADSFNYKANDGTFDSNVAAVNITVVGSQTVYFFPMDTNPGWTFAQNWGF